MGHLYSLSDNVHFCQIDGVDILLDAKKNQYLSFIGEQVKWFSEIRHARTSDSLSDKAAAFALRLLQKEIIRNGQSKKNSFEPCNVPRPCKSIFDVDCIIHKPIQPSDLVKFFYALTYSWIIWKIHYSHINKIFSAIKRWKKCVTNTNEISVDEVNVRIAIFHDISPYFMTTHNACFFRSVCLIRYLTLFHVDCNLVFGVQTSPFAAHCWVERDGMVLNDYLDNVLDYTKIVTV